LRQGTALDPVPMTYEVRAAAGFGFDDFWAKKKNGWTIEAIARQRGSAFEGAHRVRRCAALSKSAHLGKPRGFLRRCAPFSKVRTEN